MPYLWEDILQEWLLNQNLDYDPLEIVDAFNQVEKTLGSDWIGLTFGTFRGAWAAISIIELGKILGEVEKTPNGSKLIKKIKDNYPNKILRDTLGRKVDPSQFKVSDPLHELAHSLQVARLVAHYTRHSCIVEIEPELIVNGRRRFPDLRVKSDSKWVYVEVVCPGFSEETQEIYRTLSRISNLTGEIRLDRVVEVYLYKVPNGPKISQIIGTCKLLAQRDLQPQECNISNVAQIFTNPWNEELLPNFAPGINEKRPLLFLASLLTSEEGMGHGRRCIVKIPFSDERAQRVLDEKSGQLSRTDPGLIVIDVSGIPGGFKLWPELIKRRLQPSLNQRISGVLITENPISGRTMIVKKSLVKHPNPIHSLSEDFLTLTSSSS